MSQNEKTLADGSKVFAPQYYQLLDWLDTRRHLLYQMFGKSRVCDLSNIEYDKLINIMTYNSSGQNTTTSIDSTSVQTIGFSRTSLIHPYGRFKKREGYFEPYTTGYLLSYPQYWRPIYR